MELFSIPKFKSILNEKKTSYITDAIKMLEIEQKKLSEYINKEKNTFILFRRYTNRDLKKMKHLLELINSDLDSLKKSQQADAKAVGFKFFDSEALLQLNYIDFKSYIPTMEYHTYISIRNLIVLYNLNFCDIHKIDYFDKVKELAIEIVNHEDIIEDEILRISTCLRSVSKDKTNLGYVLNDENNNAALILTVYDGN